MAMSDAFALALGNLLFDNTTLATIGDATGLVGSTADGNYYVALHTADPTAGTQSTSEATYTGYARVAVARTTAGWTVSTNTVTNAAAITFGECTAGSDTLTHATLGAETSGATLILLVGTVSLSVSSGITPEFGAGELDFAFTADDT